jgi:hypothetical protein
LCARINNRIICCSHQLLVIDLTTRVLEDRALSVPIFDGSDNNGRGRYLSKPEIIKNSLLARIFEPEELQPLLLVKIDSKNPDANHLKARTFKDGIRRKLAFSSGKNYCFADDSLRTKINRLFATEPDTTCRYGSLLVSNYHKSADKFTNLRIKIVDFKDPQYADDKTDYCHGKISPQLAKQLGGERNCPLEFRFAWMKCWAEADNSQSPKTSFLAKGTFLPDAKLTDAQSYDIIIMDISSVKGIKKSHLKDLIPCGEYEFPQAVIGNQGNTKATSYDNRWQFTIWYSEAALKEDFSQPTLEKAQALAELQRNPLALPKYIVQQYDKQQAQQEQSEEALNEIEGDIKQQAQKSRWISLLRSDKYGQLVETPRFRNFATDYVAHQWRDLAIKSGYSHSSGMAMPCDAYGGRSHRLPRGTVCVPDLLVGDVILTRYPIVDSDSIRLYRNVHDPEFKKTRNVVWIHPEDAEEYHQADFDGDQLMVNPASKLPNIAKETLRAGEPGRFEPVKQPPKVP